MNLKVEVITPERARALLERRAPNRKLRQYWVDYLASIMQRGDWRLTHQGIALDVHGNLIDGQHRLAAIVQTGLPQTMIVAYDCPSDLYDAIDEGLKRQSGDRLFTHHHEAAVAAHLARLADGLSLGAKIAPMRLRQAYELHKQSIRQVCSHEGNGVPNLRTALVRGCFVRALEVEKGNPRVIGCLVDTGRGMVTNLDTDSAALILRNYLSRYKDRFFARSRSDSDLHSIIATVETLIWNYVHGIATRKLPSKTSAVYLLRWLETWRSSQP